MKWVVILRDRGDAKSPLVPAVAGPFDSKSEGSEWARKRGLPRHVVPIMRPESIEERD